jgi:hypothetical protein
MHGPSPDGVTTGDWNRAVTWSWLVAVAIACTTSNPVATTASSAASHAMRSQRCSLARANRRRYSDV